MKKFLILFLVIASIRVSAFNTGSETKNVIYVENTKRSLNPKLQHQLREQSAWAKFESAHPGWFVEFNEDSKMPHRAFGAPITVPSTNLSFEDKALFFISTELSGFNIPLSDLTVTASASNGKYHQVDFIQKYKGLDVYASRIIVRFNKDGKIVLFGIDGFNNIDLDIQPQITDPGTYALNGVVETVKSIDFDGKMVILPVPKAGKYEYKLAYQLVVNTMNENIPGQFFTLVDAVSGKILYRYNKVRYCGSHDSHEPAKSAAVTPPPSTIRFPVTAMVYDPHPYRPLVERALPHMVYQITPTNVYYSDSSGIFNIPLGTANGTFFLRGRYANVLTGQTASVTPFFAQAVDTNTSVFAFDNRGLAPNTTTPSHLSAYYHTNVIHDHMKNYFPTFGFLDQPLTVRVERTDGTCNAFYDGSSINFYVNGGGCNGLSKVNDVVYHEYGHGINSRYYQFRGVSGNMENGGQNEGYADVWAISITDNPLLGVGFDDTDSTVTVRRYDINGKVYPKDLVGQVHADGEIIAGAWWDTRRLTGSLQLMTNLFTESMFFGATAPNGFEGQLYRDILEDALFSDDDDGNPANGTPNGANIVAAFGLHGINLIGDAYFTFAEQYSASAAQPITISTDIVSSAFNTVWTFYFSSGVTPQLFYRTSKNVAFTQVPMVATPGSTTQYDYVIPTQPAGTIVEYYMALVDANNQVIIAEPEAYFGTDPTLPYFLMVGFDIKKTDDHDGNFNQGWLEGLPGDNATTGIWAITIPISSLDAGGNICQTGDNFTPGGLVCAVTGNASSATAGMGENDVDGGKTSLQSPKYLLNAYTDPAITYQRWYTNSPGGGASPGIDYWRVYASKDSVNWVLIEETQQTDASWRRNAFYVKDYLPGANEIWLRFVAEDDLPGSLVEAAVDDVEIHDVSIVGVQELANENISITVFPNPSHDILFVKSNGDLSGDVVLEVYNNLGQSVLSKTVKSQAFNQGNTSIDLSNVSTGVYSLLVKNGSNVLSTSLIKN